MITRKENRSIHSAEVCGRGKTVQTGLSIILRDGTCRREPLQREKILCKIFQSFIINSAYVSKNILNIFFSSFSKGLFIRFRGNKITLFIGKRNSRKSSEILRLNLIIPQYLRIIKNNHRFWRISHLDKMYKS